MNPTLEVHNQTPTSKVFQESKNVVGVVVVNSEGFPVMTSLDSTLTVQVTMEQVVI